MTICFLSGHQLSPLKLPWVTGRNLPFSPGAKLERGNLVETLPMPLQFPLASQTGRAQRKRLSGCWGWGWGWGRELVREGYHWSGGQDRQTRHQTSGLLPALGLTKLCREPCTVPSVCSWEGSRRAPGDSTYRETKSTKWLAKGIPNVWSPLQLGGGRGWGAGKRTQLGVWGFR